MIIRNELPESLGGEKRQEVEQLLEAFANHASFSFPEALRAFIRIKKITFALNVDGVECALESTLE